MPQSSPSPPSSDISEPLTPPPCQSPARKLTFSIPRKGESFDDAALGLSPSVLVGRVLKRVSRSSTHPVITLYFTDNTTYQVRVDGYDPMYPGLPKAIETDPELEPILNDIEAAHADAAYTIVGATTTTLTDRAYQSGEHGKKDAEWKQSHSALAFKFKEEGKWHCMWATRAEFDALGRCTFRSYDDVYLEKVERSQSQHKKAKGKRRGRKGKKTGSDV
ncbi:hypothetical protein K474DRAFT_1635942 [Panus rudis PR-1116 ss-1]|nr:hypothetical protein K474DRAFT_1635942 [Panus rudis PR-1116 ss-1]